MWLPWSVSSPDRATPDCAVLPAALAVERKNKCMLFMSTTVKHGHGRAVVVATGMVSEFGKTFQQMRDVEQKKTPLQVHGCGAAGGDVRRGAAEDACGVWCAAGDGRTGPKA